MAVMILMTFTTGSHVLMKVLACALMLRFNQTWFALYSAVDVGIFFCYKIARRDFRYWARIYGGMSWITTFILRLVTKIIVDFTLIVHFRSPLELGGAYWSFNLFLNQIFCIASVFLYGKYSSDDVDDQLVRNLWIVILGLIAFSMLNFYGFLSVINSEYIDGFISFTTGKQYIVANFDESETDEKKFMVFSFHKSYYRSRETQLKAWVAENWDKWMEEEPAWFTEYKKAHVPSEYLPAKTLESLGGHVGRRKSSAAAIKDERREIVAQRIAEGKKPGKRGNEETQN